MRSEYDFSKATRGAVVHAAAGKERITIRLDGDVLAWFRAQAHRAGGGNYQTHINAALRAYVQGKSGSFERTIRRVIREELKSSRTPRAKSRRAG